MGITVLYVRISSLDGKTDRQRVNEKEFDKVIEDKCSGSIPMFERDGGRQTRTDDLRVMSPTSYLLQTVEYLITIFLFFKTDSNN